MEANIFKCFIASPSDTMKEREICDRVFIEINKTLGEKFGFRIESLKWENDTKPCFSEYPQAAINEQMGCNYQIFVGIMNRKFGTPTKTAGSGTEEEFNNAYDRVLNKEKVEIMFYFNDEAPLKLSDIDPIELTKVNAFKKKMSELGGYYWIYNGINDFEERLRNHLNKYFIKEFTRTDVHRLVKDKGLKDNIRNIFQNRLDDALCVYCSNIVIWVEPILSKTNEISSNPDDNYNNRINLSEIISNPTSTIIKAPPQFGLTSLAHYLVKEAWENDDLWIYIDSENTKSHNIHNAVKNEVNHLGLDLDDIKCIILDSWNNYESSSFKKLKSLCDSYNDIPLIVMHTIDDSKFMTEPNKIKIEREFNVLHLLALPRKQIRKVVSEYNKVKGIGEEDVVLAKVVSDLEVLNIHRTPMNCLTLLKVSEKYFDESPVNRTEMLKMVLVVLFDMDGIPTYKTKPDLKDCEYVLGRFCENMIKNDFYEFSRDSFLIELKAFCKDKLIDLEVEVVFDVLKANNIIIKRDFNYIFRSSYWIFYFAAKRMHIDKAFADYIFKTKKYVAFPEIIEFYTGIDRNRTDALRILTADIKSTCDVVNSKVKLPENMNPFALIQWHPTNEQIEKVQNEISESVLNSGLPESIKDQHADKSYNQIRPYNQSIQTFFEQYSLHNLMQEIKASSRALRNSDYVEPETKREILQEILRSWEQMTKVLLALTPVLASKGYAAFEGAAFHLNGDFGSTFEERVNRIIQCNPTNVVGFFKDDLFSSKIGPLLYDQFINEKNPLKKHQLALFLIFTRPREWKKYIQEYIVEIPKNSFYLFDTVNALRARYRYDFATNEVLKEIEYLIKMGLAKHEFGVKRPLLDIILKISNKILPKRDFKDLEEELN